MGQFEETSTGDGNLMLGGVTAGFVRNCSFSIETTELELWTGSPEQFQGSHPQRQSATFTAEVLELSMLNIGRITGNQVHVVLAAPVNVVDKLYTFETSGNYLGALERLMLDGPGVTSLVVEPEGGGTPFVAGEDYLLDGTSQGLLRLEGGDIEEGATVQCSYTYTPVESTEVRGGVTFQRQRSSLEFIHPKYRKGTNLIISHSIVEPSASQTWNFASGDFIAPSVSWRFVRDNASAYPLYRIREVAMT